MKDPRFLDDEPRARKSKLAMVLAVSMHVLLFGLLFFGLRWNSEKPAPAMAELWSQIPNVQPVQRAAPTPEPAPEPPKPEPIKPVPPKPAPKVEPPKPQPKAEVKPVPKPDIALEKEKARKAKEKAEADKAEKAREDKAKEDKAKQQKAEADRKKAEEKKAEDARIEAQRKQNLAHFDNAPAIASSAPIKGPTTTGDPRAKANYVDKIRAKVRGNIVLPDNIPGNPEAVFQVQQLPSGEVISVKMVHSSGVKAYDDAVERAIWKSSALPLPDSKEVFERTLNLRFRPLDVAS